MIRINPCFIEDYENYLNNLNKQDFIRIHLDGLIINSFSQPTQLFSSLSYQKALAKQRKHKLMREQIRIVKKG